MTICKALLKYGYSSFSFAIVEYCDADIRIKRENYYIKLFAPKYNVLKEAGLPPVGTKSEEVKQRISLASSYAYKIQFKDMLEDKTLSFHSLTAACLFFRIDIHTLNRYINKVTKKIEGTPEPLLGRYTL
jgi:hypothetical protein